jgi:hypothetical protein
MEQRAGTKFCVKLKKVATETFEILKCAYGEECLWKTSVFQWHTTFKEGREPIQDDARKGRVVPQKAAPPKFSIFSPMPPICYAANGHSTAGLTKFKISHHWDTNLLCRKVAPSNFY